MNKKRLYKWLMTLIGAVVTILLLHTFFISSCIITYSQPSNHLEKGDHIVINKWSYGLRLPFMDWIGYHRWCTQRISQNDIVVFNNPANFTEKSIDNREVLIGKAIAGPNDTLWVDRFFNPIKRKEQKQEDKLERPNCYISFNKKDQLYIDSIDQANDSIIFSVVDSLEQKYIAALTTSSKEKVSTLLSDTTFIHLEKKYQPQPKELALIIPQKGYPIAVNTWNITLLRNTILLHEKKKAEIINDTLFIDGRATSKYCFSKDYYWMGSNSINNEVDSKFYGFVPEDHIIGKAWFIWCSKEIGSSYFKGFQWDRFFNIIN